MNASDAMREIESPQYSGFVNVASSVKVFVRAMASRPAVTVLFKAMDQEGAARAVFGRLFQIAGQEPEEGYENSGDAALATYLVLLTVKKLDLAKLAAMRVRECKRCYWAYKIADLIGPDAAPYESHSGLGHSIVPYDVGLMAKYSASAASDWYFTATPIISGVVGTELFPARAGTEARFIMSDIDPSGPNRVVDFYRNVQTKNEPAVPRPRRQA